MCFKNLEGKPNRTIFSSNELRPLQGNWPFLELRRELFYCEKIFSHEYYQHCIKRISKLVKSNQDLYIYIC